MMQRDIVSYVYISTFAVIFLFVIHSFSFNPPNGNTGAPGEGYCVDCHQPGQTPIAGEILIEGLEDTVPAGSLLSLRIQIKSGSGSPLRAGFQMTILDTLDENFGELLNPGDSCAVQYQPDTDRFYAEHDQKAKLFKTDSTVTYTVEWQTPPDRSNEFAKFYAVSMLANGNGNNSGDKFVIFRRSVFVEGNTTTDQLTENKELSVILYPNPAVDVVSIKWDHNSFKPTDIKIFDVQGKLIRIFSIDGQGDIASVQTSELLAGLYFLYLTDSKKKMVLPLVKH